MLVIKVIDDHWRRIKRPVHCIVIGQVIQPDFGGISPQFRVEHLPIAALPVLIYAAVQWQQPRVLRPDEVQNDGAIAPPQIEVFQPDQIALSPTRRMIAFASVMPGKTGEMKQVVRTPAR